VPPCDFLETVQAALAGRKLRSPVLFDVVFGKEEQLCFGKRPTAHAIQDAELSLFTKEVDIVLGSQLIEGPAPGSRLLEARIRIHARVSRGLPIKGLIELGEDRDREQDREEEAGVISGGAC
jgi:hypothetical protein